MREIKDLIKETLAEEGLKKVEDLLKVKKAWEKMGGLPKGAPCGFKGEKLVVRVDSHAWAQEFSVRRKEVIERVRDETGLKIEDIIIKYKPQV